MIMPTRFTQWLGRKVAGWLTKETAPVGVPICDIDRLCYEIRPGDVILLEGRSRVSEVIKLITQSPWTHSALYIGRLYDFEDPDARECIQYFYDGDPNDQLILEALLGQGTIIAPITKYRHDHLRICRPKGLSPADAHKVITYTIKQLGSDYDVRQLFDLARFLLPWRFLPRRWRSSLFQHNVGAQTRTVCSCLLAEAFTAIDYPILPFVDRSKEGGIRLIKRNPKLFSPKDFDYSPYFDIIKYPYLGLDDLAAYRRLPWSEEELLYNDEKAPILAGAEDPDPTPAGGTLSPSQS